MEVKNIKIDSTVIKFFDDYLDINNQEEILEELNCIVAASIRKNNI